MAKEYQRKAEILKQLTRVVAWPTGVIPNNKLNLCVLGKLPYPKAIRALAGASTQPYKIIIRLLNTPIEAQDCQIVFVADSEKENETIQLLSKKPILLVGDMNNFARNGGSMNFMSLNETIALTVNLASLKDSGLTLDMKTFSNITILPDSQDLK